MAGVRRMRHGLVMAFRVIGPVTLLLVVTTTDPTRRSAVVFGFALGLTLAAYVARWED